MLTVDTDRLRLRRFAATDIDWLVALDNDPEVMRFINGGEPVSRNYILRNILPVFMRPDVLPGFRVISLRDDDVALGWCCLRGDRGPPRLGYRLQRSAWGQGYAVEAARGLLNAGFGQGTDLVTATTYEDNIASVRVLEKLGFSLRRRFRADPAEQDTARSGDAEPWPGWDLEYQLTRDEWNPGAADTMG